MYLIPEKELYTIIQQFYAGKYDEISKLDLNIEFDFTNAIYEFEARNFQIRSNFFLKSFKKSTDLIKVNEKLIENSDIDTLSLDLLKIELDALKMYSNFLQNKDLVAVNDFFDKIELDDSTLASLYKQLILLKKDGINDETEKKLESIHPNPEKNLETSIFTSLLNYYLNNKQIKSLSPAELKKHFSDALILDFNIAWFGLILDNFNAESNINLKNSYYFFEELCNSSNTESVKTWISLLVCHLKLCHFPEAKECIEKIELLKTSDSLSLSNWEESFLINKISLYCIDGDKENYEKSLAELKKNFASSDYLKDLQEKNRLFDEIVAQY